MRLMARTAVAAVVSVVLVGCAAPGTGPSPAPGPNGSGTPTTTTATTTTTTPDDTTPAIDAPLSVQGDAGGVLRVDGQEFDRFDERSGDNLIATLGTPDESREQTQCYGDAVANVAHRWGPLTITVFKEQPGVPYAEEFPVGAIAGWQYDPTAHAEDPMVQFSGPEGVTIGDTLASLSEAFEDGDWDTAGLDNDTPDRTYSIFVGDTTGALFFLTPDDTVKSMAAGFAC